MKKLTQINEVYLKTGCRKTTMKVLRHSELMIWAKKFMNSPKGKIYKLIAKYKEHKNKPKIEKPIKPPKEKTVKPISQKNEWKEYKKTVWKLTSQQPIHTLEHHEKRGFKSYHLDHVLSILEGFKRKLPPEIIAHISNLRFIPHKQNTDKNTKTVYTNLFNEDIQQVTGKRRSRTNYSNQ